MTRPDKPDGPRRPESLTVAILREIRDEIRTTREDLGKRIDATNARLDGTNERLATVEQALVELAQQQRFIVRMLGVGGERDRRLERRMDALDSRVGALESRVGGPPAR